MSKTEKFKGKGFREFYEESEEGKPKKKLPPDYKKNRSQVKNKLRKFDHKNFSEEDFDDDIYHH